MQVGVQIEENEVTLLGRAFDARRGRFPVGMAREILEARLPAADHARMDELSAKARAGFLLPEERALLDRYVRATNLLALDAGPADQQGSARFHADGYPEPIGLPVARMIAPAGREFPERVRAWNP